MCAGCGDHACHLRLSQLGCVYYLVAPVKINTKTQKCMCFRPCASGILNSNGNQILPTLVLLPSSSSSPSPCQGLPHQVRVNIVSKAMAPSNTLGKVDVLCREWQFCLGAVSKLVSVEFGRCDRASFLLTIVWRSPVRSYHWAGPITGNQRFVSPDLNDRAIAVSDRCDQ